MDDQRVPTDADRESTGEILPCDCGNLCRALAGRVRLHSVRKPHAAMDDAPLSTISLERCAAHPWLLCMALR